VDKLKHIDKLTTKFSCRNNPHYQKTYLPKALGKKFNRCLAYVKKRYNDNFDRNVKINGHHYKVSANFVGEERFLNKLEIKIMHILAKII